MQRILALLATLFAATGMLVVTPAPVSAQQLWSVWNNTAQCAPTRNHWLSVAQSPPGFGFIQWGTFSTPDFMAAIAQMDAMRLSEQFRNYCCKFSVWRFSPTNQFVILKDGEVAGQNYILERGGMCADDAAISAGISAPHLTDVNLGSVPGVALRATATGFIAVAAAPVTIPSTPPVVVAPGPAGPGPTAAGGGPVLPEGTLIGCFKDTNDFDVKGYLERSQQNTPQRCISICKQKGFRYAGLQYSESCLCGNSYGKYGPANNCNMKCTGGPMMCGGYSSNHVYATGL